MSHTYPYYHVFAIPQFVRTASKMYLLQYVHVLCSRSRNSVFDARKKIVDYMKQNIYKKLEMYEVYFFQRL